MRQIIKDYSTTVPFVMNGKTYNRTIELRIERWGDEEQVPIAYSFNNYDEEEFLDRLAQAIEKYRAIKFVSGVTGHSMKSIIQASVAKSMQLRFGSRLTIESGSIFRLLG